MTPTRDHLAVGPQLDTGTGVTPASRPNMWDYQGPADVPSVDTGIGSPLASRTETLGTGDAFIPPLWR